MEKQDQEFSWQEVPKTERKHFLKTLAVMLGFTFFFGKYVSRWTTWHQLDLLPVYRRRVRREFITWILYRRACLYCC